MGRRDGPGVFISALVPGGLAEQNGVLLQVFLPFFLANIFLPFFMASIFLPFSWCKHLTYFSWQTSFHHFSWQTYFHNFSWKTSDPFSWQTSLLLLTFTHCCAGGPDYQGEQHRPDKRHSGEFAFFCRTLRKTPPFRILLSLC